MNVAVILDDEVIRKALPGIKQAAVDRGRLLDDVQERHHKHDAAQPVHQSVPQGEGQHRERLA